MILLASAMLLFAPAPEIARLTISAEDRRCRVREGDAELSSDDFLATARRWASEGVEVQIAFDPETPYRCVGGAIYTFQRAGFAAGPDFPADAPGRMTMRASVRLGIESGKCQPTIGDARISMEALRALGGHWQRNQPEVHFMPGPGASFGCIEAVLAILRDANVTKLGFVGNEAFAPENAQ